MIQPGTLDLLHSLDNGGIIDEKRIPEVIMKKSFRTSGTCASMIDVEVEDGVIIDVGFSGGCEGNLTGVSRLVTGMQVNDAIERLRGITCGRKSTSCPDQLAKALESMQH